MEKDFTKHIVFRTCLAAKLFSQLALNASKNHPNRMLAKIMQIEC